MLFPAPSIQEVMVALLILLRVSALIIFLPVLGHRLVPPPVKAGLIVMITLLLYPVVEPHVPIITPEPLVLMLFAIQELLFAGMLALLASLIFASVQFAGQVMSFQMGMSIANVLDPITSSQGAITAQLASILAMLLWLATNSHHMFLLALADSFQRFPIGQAWSMHAWSLLNDAAAHMFVLALKLVSPVLLLLFFVNVALGLISRAVPQIQVFFVSFPLTVGLGLFAFALALPAFIALTHDAFIALGQSLPSLMRALHG